jgi:hypothetical protein
VDGPKKGTDSQKFVYTQTVTPTSDQTAETQVMAALQSTFYSAYGDGNTAGWVQLNSANPTTTTGTTTADLNTVLPELKIPWGFESSDAGNIGYLFPAPINTTDPTLSATSNTASQTRAQKNQVLNNYLQSINSQISLLNDKVDSQSQMQNAASTEKSQITNVVETILRQLKDILTSIYPS